MMNMRVLLVVSAVLLALAAVPATATFEGRLARPRSLAATGESTRNGTSVAERVRLNHERIVQRQNERRRWPATFRAALRRPVYEPNGQVRSHFRLPNTTMPLRDLLRTLRTNATLAQSTPSLALQPLSTALANYGQLCPNQQDTCASGYFCVDNQLCLKGQPADYSVAELLTAGAVAKLIDDAFGVELDCVKDIGATFTELFEALDAWVTAPPPAEAKQKAMPHLKNAIDDLSKAFSDCSKVLAATWWQKLLGWLKSVIEAFFPEVKLVIDVYEIVIHGVDLYDDFDDMLSVCASDSPQVDYIQCGSDLGDIVYITYNAITSKKK